MKSTFALGLLPCLCIAAALPALSKDPSSLFRRQSGECENLGGGAGEAGKQAVGDFFRTTYISGKACPEGEPDTTLNYVDWCGSCGGAVQYFNNAHSDDNAVCFTVDDFNAAFDLIRADKQTCSGSLNKDPYLQFLYGRQENYDFGGEQPCTNIC